MLDVGGLIRNLQSTDAALDVVYFEHLVTVLHSKEIRDVDDADLNNLFSSLWNWRPTILEQYIFEIELNSEAKENNFEKYEVHELKLTYFWDSILSLISLPELDVKFASTLPQFTGQYMSSIFQLIIMLACTYDPPPQKLQAIKVIRTSKSGLKLSRTLVCFVHWIYQHRSDLRPYIRKLLCSSLLTLGDNAGFRKDAGAGPVRAHVQPLLEVLLPIISGLPLLDDTSVYSNLLNKVLIPLHQPNEFVEWRSQVPVIQDYHPALVKCLLAVVRKSVNTLLPCALQVILNFNENEFMQPQRRNLQSQTALPTIWPNKASANHIKELLLMEEIESVLNLCTIQIFESNAVLHNMLLSLICHLCGEGTEHIRIIQRALIMLKNNHVLDLLFIESKKIVANSREVMRRLVSVLYRKGNKSWNPTVNKMTAQCLLKLKQFHETDFAFAAECLGGKPGPIKQLSSSLIAEGKSQGGTFIPPNQLAGGNKISTAPAPLAFPKPRPLTSFSSTNVSRAAWQTLKDGDRVAASNASMTVTGVAPWAIQQQQIPRVAYDAKPRISQTSAAEAVLDKHERKYSDDTEKSPMEILMQYIDDCRGKPRSSSSDDANEMDNDEDESLAAAQKSWNIMQQSVSPVLLPDLRFLDLVWGHDLGEGAFSTVRYARVITKERSRIAWPEYAVKIISKDKISSENYLANVEREINILHLLVHPGVSRLISAFRYKESYYMVLEYCPGGDLHSYVMQNGALSELYTRFIIMEIAIALSYIHNLGFIYFDLKPENVLITATGHVKLTDFGGTRPYSQQARDLLTKSRGILNSLRNGDWRDHRAENSLTAGSAFNEHKMDVDTGQEDNRLEGTPGYMAPEALLLSASSYNQSSLSPRSTAAASSCTVISTKVDAWSLGCLVHFCVYGGPIYFGDRDDVLAAIFNVDDNESHACNQKVTDNDATARRVRFKSSSQKNSNSSNGHVSFQTALLETSVEIRMSVSQAIQHWYLTIGAGVTDGDCEQIRLNPDTIHTSPSPVPLLFNDKTQTRSGAAGEADWQRRQLSVLIAPLPDSQDYSHGAVTGVAKRIINTSGLPPYTLNQIDDLEQEILSSGFI